MQIYYQLLGVVRVSNATQTLKLTDNYFHQFLIVAINDIYSHSILLQVKFLGVNDERPAPCDEDLSAVIKNQLEKLSNQHEFFSMQDNIEALKKKLRKISI